MARSAHFCRLGCSLFAVLVDGTRRFLGALRGPVEVSSLLLYLHGATRPTIPVAGLSAITHTLIALQNSGFEVSVQWGTDSLYAFGIVLYGHAASADLDLVTKARAEARPTQGFTQTAHS